MKTLSLIGILISILGIVLCLGIIDNFVAYGNKLIDYLNLNHKEIKHEIFSITSVLDTGRTICFVLMGLFAFNLFVCTKVYRSRT
ncbi:MULTISPECIES: hypothetical protein [Chryseobacterium]|uniref:Uncharacterized protein n=1 Tax=Chryseobacterium gambrini TaxID=373672 RepID=A0AAJ1VNU0_9FLAO|nr:MULTISPECIES: hypothetical protein [Chryseobacterium]MDN4014239.1 hypothetical protein [Chryseobacterium gambrini]PZU18904.1 MAG: hypothetical protein DI622_09425 [Chryseobacterium sp.]QWA37151.1 hypothetical protein KKI44_14565 [Chryseobacterium sp. ZHDP1]CEJ72022.1 hypothetical protein BN1195_04379 [Chryseobacterium oranimense G311]